MCNKSMCKPGVDAVEGGTVYVHVTVHQIKTHKISRISKQMFRKTIPIIHSNCKLPTTEIIRPMSSPQTSHLFSLWQFL